MLNARKENVSTIIFATRFTAMEDKFNVPSPKQLFNALLVKIAGGFLFIFIMNIADALLPPELSDVVFFVLIGCFIACLFLIEARQNRRKPAAAPAPGEHS